MQIIILVSKTGLHVEVLSVAFAQNAYMFTRISADAIFLLLDSTVEIIP